MNARIAARRTQLSRLACTAALLVLPLGLSCTLAACGSSDTASTSGTESQTTAASAQVTVPDVVGMKGDKARRELKVAGLTGWVNMEDAKGKESVWKDSNWSVVAQEPAAGTQVPADQKMTLKMSHDSADAKASAEASASAATAAEAAASAAAEQRAAQEQAECERAAQEEAAKQQQAQQPEPAPGVQQPAQQPIRPLVGNAEGEGGDPGQADVYYSSCKEARAAGAAPIHKGEPGYRSGLDGDHDGVACEPKRK